MSEVNPTVEEIYVATQQSSGALRTQKMEWVDVRGRCDLRGTLRGDAAVVKCSEHPGNELNLCPRSIRPS